MDCYKWGTPNNCTLYSLEVDRTAEKQYVATFENHQIVGNACGIVKRKNGFTKRYENRD